MSLIIVAMFCVGYFGRDTRVIEGPLLVSSPAAIIAVIAAVTSIFGLVLPVSKKLTYPIALFGYTLLGATAAYLIIESGVTASPFIALWMLLSVFSGMFGLVGIALAALSVNGYVVYEVLINNIPSKDALIVFALAGELPIIISYLIWHTRNAHDIEKDQAFSAIATELSQVSGKADIVINSIADGVIAIDSASKIVLINPAALSILGWKYNDAINLDYRSILKLHDIEGNELAEEADPVQKVLVTNETIVNDNIALKTRSDKHIIVSLMISPAAQGRGGGGAIIVFRDITQQKNEEREQAEFISTASHEMRTPVASIEGYLGLALNPQTAVVDDKARSYLSKAHEAAKHLGRLFQDLLDVTKVDDGRIGNNPKVIDAVSFAADITSGFEDSAKAKGLILYFKPGAPPDTGNDLNKKLSPVFYVNTDTDHLREVVSNLIENAIKYTKQGSVTIDVTGNDQKVTFSIADSGIGIPPEDISHLFQKFYRIDNTDTREIGGTGLGLYLCRRLVEAMNGRIWVESELNKGSTFFVELDRVSHEDAMAMIEEAAAAPPAIQHDQRKMVAPDQPAGNAVPATSPAQAPVASAATLPAASTTNPALAPPLVDSAAEPLQPPPQPVVAPAQPTTAARPAARPIQAPPRAQSPTATPPQPPVSTNQQNVT